VLLSRSVKSAGKRCRRRPCSSRVKLDEGMASREERLRAGSRQASAIVTLGIVGALDLCDSLSRATEAQDEHLHQQCAPAWCSKP